jgi:transposase
MQDKELYQQILGLNSPWSVSDLVLDRAVSEIRVKVNHSPGVKYCCPDCQTELGCHDHTKEHPWRHLDSYRFMTIQVA